MHRGAKSGRILAVIVAVAVVASIVGVAPVVAVVQQQEEEPNDSREAAQEISVGEAITGDLPEQDRDWFVFTVEAGQTINVTAAAADGDLSTQFSLTDPNGNGITGARLSGDRAFFGTTAATSGTYYVQTVGVSPGRGGMAYNFTVETYRTEDVEPNEERASATEITVGEDVSGDVSVGDRDWYAFDVEAGETINVSAAAGGKAGRSTQFSLQDPDGNGLAGARLSGERGTFGTTATTGGTYYIQTVGVSPSRGGDEYNFTVETYRTDWFEPNEDRGNATRLYENPLPGDEARVTRNDRDWFAFTVDEGATINVSAAASAEQGRATQFGLFTPDGDNVGGQRLNGTNGNFGTTATTGGTYYVETVGVSPSRGGGVYNFTVDVPGRTLGLPNDRFERGNPPVGNQNRENAPEVTSGTYSLAIVDDDRDVLAVDLAEGERVRAVIDFPHDENDLALKLTDGSGTTVNSSDTDSDGEQVAFTSPEGGTYYLHISGEPDATTTYDLDLAVLERTDVTIGPGALTAPTDTTKTVNVTVTDASAGVSNVKLDLESTDTSVLRIQSVEAVGTGSISADVADDGGTATATITGRNTSVTGTVTVAQVTVVTVGSGSATLEGDATAAARSWFEYPLGTVQNTSLEVGADAGTSEGTTAAGGFGPGFGALVSLVVLVGVALLVGRR